MLWNAAHHMYVVTGQHTIFYVCVDHALPDEVGHDIYQLTRNHPVKTKYIGDRELNHCLIAIFSLKAICLFPEMSQVYRN